MKSNGHNHFYGSNGPQLGVKSDFGQQELPFTIKIYRKAYLSVLEEIKGLVFSQDNDEILQKYFYDETTNLKIKFDAAVARHKSCPSSTPAASRNEKPPKSVSSLEDDESEDGLGIIHPIIPRPSPKVFKSINRDEKKPLVAPPSEDGLGMTHHPIPRPSPKTFKSINGDEKKPLVSPSSTIENKLFKRSNTLNSTNCTQKSFQGLPKESPSLNRTQILPSSTKFNTLKSPMSSAQRKPIIPLSGSVRTTKIVPSFPISAPSPDLLSSIIKSQSLSLGVPHSSMTNKKTITDEPRKVSANNSLINSAENITDTTLKPEPLDLKKGYSPSATNPVNILSQDLDLSTDDSDLEFSNEPLKIDLDPPPSTLPESSSLDDQEMSPEVPPCDNQSEASSKTSKVSCKKRKRKSCISNLFSDTSDDDDDDDNSPKKLYIQLKSPSDHASSSKSQVDISESSDEESFRPPVKPEEPKASNQTDLNEAMIITEEKPAFKSSAESTLPQSGKDLRHIMERPNFSIDTRPLATGCHSSGETFLEELLNAVRDEVNEKHQFMMDSKYLAIDLKVVGQIKDLICSQLGRLNMPNQGKCVISSIVELLARDTDVQAESRDIIYQQIILEKIKDEKSAENSSFHCQNVSALQCKLVMLVFAMDKSGKFENFSANLMKLIRSSLFVRLGSKTIKTWSLINLTKFYVTLCKTEASIDCIGDFMVNLFHSEPTRVHLLLTTIIETWPGLLRDYRWEGRLDPLIQTIFWIIFNKGNRGDENVRICHERLKTLCGVERYSVSATDLVLILVDWAKNYIGHHDVMKSLTGCFRMLTRYFDSQWLYSNVLNILLNMMKEVQALDEPAAKKEARLTWVVETVGTVGRNFPSTKRNISLEFLEPIMDILKTKDPTPGPALETACIKSLVLLGQYLQMQVVNFLSEWHPVYQLEDSCKKILANYLDQRARSFFSRKIVGITRNKLNALNHENSLKKESIQH